MRSKRGKIRISAAARSKTVALVSLIAVFISAMSPVLPAVAKGEIVPAGAVYDYTLDIDDPDAVEKLAEHIALPSEIGGENVSLAPPEPVSEKRTETAVRTNRTTSKVAESQKPEKVEEPAIVYSDDEIVLTGEANGVEVIVQAERDAFPEGVYMVVTPVEDEAFAGIVDETVGKADSFTALDIAFYDAEFDAEIEPAKPIKVNFVYPEMAGADDAAVVHLDDEGTVTVVDNTSLKNDTVSFSSGEFSVYIIVKKVVERKTVLASGETVNVTVEVADENDVARLTDLRLTEFDEDSDEYWNAYDAVVAEKYAEDSEFDEESFGFFAVDIDLLDEDGNEFEPEGSVSVKMELVDLPADKDVLTSSMEVRHIIEEDGAITGVEKVAVSDDVATVDGIITAEFSVESFSEYVLTWETGKPIRYAEEGIVRVKLQDSNNAVIATINVHYVDNSGTPIKLDPTWLGTEDYQLYGADDQRPYDNTYYLEVNSPLFISDLVSASSTHLVGSYTFDKACYGDLSGDDVTEVTAIVETTTTPRTGYEYYGTTIAEGADQGRIPGDGSNAPSDYNRWNWYGDIDGNQQVWFVDGRWRPANDDKHGRWTGDVYRGRTVNVDYSEYNHTVTFYDGDETVDTLTRTTAVSTSTSVWPNVADVYLIYENKNQYTTYSSTVHFVTWDEEQRKYVEIEKAQSAPDADVTSINFASQYPIDNYVYTGAFYKTNENVEGQGEVIYSEIYNNGFGWEYAKPLYIEVNGETVDSGLAATPRYAIENGSHLYIVYDPVSEEPSEPNEDDPKPTTNKNVIVNDDGTRTIELILEGDSIDVVSDILANVIIVFDRTTSMGSTTDPNSKWNKAKVAVNALVDVIVGDDGEYSQQIDFALITFDRLAQIPVQWTKNEETLKTYVSQNLSQATMSGTNWEAAFRATASVLDARPDNDPTYVIFVTDGEANTDFRPNDYPFTGGYGTGYTGYSDNEKTYGGGKNHDNEDGPYGLFPSTELSKDEARIVAQNSQFYGIFIFEEDEVPASVEEGTNNQFNKLRSVVNGQGGVATIPAVATNISQVFDEIAHTIKDTMGPYNVGVNDGVPSLATVGTSVVGTIKSTFSYYKATRVYDKENNVWPEWTDDQFVEIKSIEDDPVYGQARYDEGQGVVWDLSKAKQIGKDTAYKLSFVVWPTQDAYDLIADLNNTATLARENAEKAADEKEQEDGPFESDEARQAFIDEYVDSAMEELLKDKGLMTEGQTLAEAFANYGITKTDDGKYTLNTNTVVKTRYSFGGVSYEVNPFDENNPMPQGTMPLPTETISVIKEWHNPVDSHSGDENGTKLYVMRDGKLYLYERTVDGEVIDDSIVVRPNGPTEDDPLDRIWPADREVYISCGQIRTLQKGETDSDPNVYEVIEPGHDYALAEPEIFSYYWDLTAFTYHPMVIDGESVVLILDDSIDPEETSLIDGKDYFIIEGPDKKDHVYRIGEAGEDQLYAKNDRRSHLNFKKAIDDKTDDQSADKDTFFEYTCTFTNIDEDVYFSAYLSGAGINGYMEVEGTGIQPEISEDPDKIIDTETGWTGYYYAAVPENSTTTSFTFKIKAGWNVRFMNLPVGTKYTIVESPMPEGFAFESASGQAWNYTTETYESSYPLTVTKTSRKVEGEILESNHSYTVVVTNEFLPENLVSLIVNKQWNSGGFVVDSDTNNGHGTVSIGLFRDANNDNIITIDELIPNSIREIVAPSLSVTYSNLTSVDGIIVRELEIKTVVVEEEGEGEATTTTVITPINPGGGIRVTGETTSIGENATNYYIATYTPGTATAAGSRTDKITNTLPTISVNKTDPSNNPLKSAKFMLTGSDESTPVSEDFSEITSTDSTSGNLLNGIHLSEGTYYLVETKAPDGYLMIDYKIKITVKADEDGYMKVTAEKVSPMVEQDDGSEQEDSEGSDNVIAVTRAENKLSFTFGVTNVAGTVLPDAGGPGVYGYQLVGGLTSLSSLAWIFRRKRYRKF